MVSCCCCCWRRGLSNDFCLQGNHLELDALEVRSVLLMQGVETEAPSAALGPGGSEDQAEDAEGDDDEQSSGEGKAFEPRVARPAAQASPSNTQQHGGSQQQSSEQHDKLVANDSPFPQPLRHSAWSQVCSLV